MLLCGFIQWSKVQEHDDLHQLICKAPLEPEKLWRSCEEDGKPDAETGTNPAIAEQMKRNTDAEESTNEKEW